MSLIRHLCVRTGLEFNWILLPHGERVRERDTHTHIQTHTLALDKLNMLTRHYSRKHCYVSRGTKRYKRLASASMSQRCDQTSDDAFSAPRGASLPRAVCQDNLNPATLPVQVRAVCVCVCVCLSVCLSLRPRPFLPLTVICNIFDKQDAFLTPLKDDSLILLLKQQVDIPPPPLYDRETLFSQGFAARHIGKLCVLYNGQSPSAMNPKS